MTDVERIARAMCIAGGGDPDRLLQGVIRNVAGEVEWDDKVPSIRSDVRISEYRYKFWRCFQTEARAAIAEIQRQPLGPPQTVIGDRE